MCILDDAGELVEAHEIDVGPASKPNANDA
jgi:hypothetical protein